MGDLFSGTQDYPSLSGDSGDPGDHCQRVHLQRFEPEGPAKDHRAPRGSRGRLTITSGSDTFSQYSHMAAPASKRPGIVRPQIMRTETAAKSPAKSEKRKTRGRIFPTFGADEAEARAAGAGFVLWPSTASQVWCCGLHEIFRGHVVLHRQCSY